jgi:hypothetical protein
MTPLRQMLLETMSWLFEDQHFEIETEQHEPRAFGDGIVVLRNDVLRLRFVNDRSQIFVEFASLHDPNKWWELTFVLEAILDRHVVVGFAVDQIASALVRFLSMITEALCRDDFQQELERLKSARMQRLGTV